MKKIFFLFLLLAALPAFAGVKICAHCGKGSRHMRFNSENRYFCSEKCAKAKIGCANCGQIPRGKYMILIGISGEHKRYCGNCSQLPRCFSCFFPAAAARRFSDNRVQCLPCSRQALSPAETQRLLEEIRYDLFRMYGYDPHHRIILRLVNKNTLRKMTNSEEALGCIKVLVTKHKKSWGSKEHFKYEWQCTLYLLDNLPGVAAGKVLSHELTHDYLYHHAGRGRDPLITEGICEAVSGAWLQSKGYHGYVDAMKKNPDPVYGAGFRKLFPELKRYGIRGLTERYRSMFIPF